GRSVHSQIHSCRWRASPPGPLPWVTPCWKRRTSPPPPPARPGTPAHRRNPASRHSPPCPPRSRKTAPPHTAPPVSPAEKPGGRHSRPAPDNSPGRQ
ncbi:hypothetical protein HEAFMP_HEAFMP_02830, partial [Dysosmobacter welbionis]